MIRTKRVYEAAEKSDGCRVLVERLWPRGLSKADASIDLWLKEVAPSTGLRKWFNHEPAKWEEFQRRYEMELQDNAALAQLREVTAGERRVTFVYAARDQERNSAIALKRFLEA